MNKWKEKYRKGFKLDSCKRNRQFREDTRNSTLIPIEDYIRIPRIIVMNMKRIGHFR